MSWHSFSFLSAAAYFFLFLKNATLLFLCHTLYDGKRELQRTKGGRLSSISHGRWSLEVDILWINGTGYRECFILVRKCRYTWSRFIVSLGKPGWRFFFVRVALVSIYIFYSRTHVIIPCSLLAMRMGL